MRERPILFSGPMVRALLEGRKTQTRRIVKFRDVPEQPDHHNVWRAWNGKSHDWQDGDEIIRCPYGVPGDRLWVRETWTADCTWPSDERADEDRWWHEVPRAFRGPSTVGYVYFGADGGLVPYQVASEGQWHAHPSGWEPTEDDLEGLRWQPSIHMPRWASRLTLEITAVRVERVQAISASDAVAEGLATLTKDGGRTWKYGIPDRDGLPGTDDYGWEWIDWCVDPAVAYSALWKSLNGLNSWVDNPWVWVLEFKITTGDIG